MTDTDNLRSITEPIIKGERPIYYLVTEEKLNDLIHNSFIGNLFFAFFSILTGAAIARNNWIYFLIGLAFLLFSVYFYYQKIRFIRKTKKSGV